MAQSGTAPFVQPEYAAAPLRAGKTVAVVGGGITGLTAAFHLASQGVTVRLFERSAQLGGPIRTERTPDGWLIEAGPNSLQESSRIVSTLIEDLGLDAQRVEANPQARRRYIVRQGRLRALPASPAGLLTTRLFSFGTKLRVLSELRMPPLARNADATLAELVAAHFGDEFVDYALDPFVSGVYAGDPRQLSARYAFPRLWEWEQTRGSLLLGQIAQVRSRRRRGEGRPRVISFRAGLQVLIEALSRRLPAGSVQLGASVDSLSPGARWRVRWHDSTGPHEEHAHSVVLALPADALARISFGTAADRPLSALEKIVHPPVASLFLGYRREHVAHPLDGFGALVPAKENRKLMGVLFSSTLFPHRAPPGHVGLTVFAGGALRPELARLSEDELHRQIQPELKALLGIEDAPLVRRMTVWPRAIPQYNVGYEFFLETMAECERRHPGIFIGGHVRDGISVPNCIEAGIKLAERAAG